MLFLPLPATKEWGEDRGEGQFNNVPPLSSSLLHRLEEREWLQLRRAGFHTWLPQDPCRDSSTQGSRPQTQDSYPRLRVLLSAFCILPSAFDPDPITLGARLLTHGRQFGAKSEKNERLLIRKGGEERLIEDEPNTDEVTARQEPRYRPSVGPVGRGPCRAPYSTHLRSVFHPRFASLRVLRGNRLCYSRPGRKSNFSQ